MKDIIGKTIEIGDIVFYSDENKFKIGIVLNVIEIWSTWFKTDDCKYEINILKFDNDDFINCVIYDVEFIIISPALLHNSEKFYPVVNKSLEILKDGKY